MFDEAFKNWFIGFSEGECSFTHTYAGYPRFSITQKNKAILEFIRYTLGFGRVGPHYKKDPTMWRYVVDCNYENLNVLRAIFEGNLRTDFRKKQFVFWVSLWNYNHPLRVAGRLKERERRRKALLRNPLLANTHRVSVRKWNRRNRVQFNVNKRKSWFRHREKNIVKLRERTIISREIKKFVKESVGICLINA
jgi:hypothetical protein